MFSSGFVPFQVLINFVWAMMSFRRSLIATTSKLNSGLLAHAYRRMNSVGMESGLFDYSTHK